MSRLALPEMAKKLVKEVPMQRMGSVKDIADATVFLFSPAAAWITGTGIVVDGGAWHRQGGSHADYYPEAVMVDMKMEGVKGQKKEKAKL